MLITVQVPSLDPMPLPGPVWLMTGLLLLVFTLHVLAMNAALGGGIWTLWNYVRGKKPEHPNSRRLAEELAKMLPIFLAYTITLGVAALLFVQVLYGRFLYASSILIGGYWIMVIPLVILAYYGYYYVSYTAVKGKSRTGLVAALSVLCLLAIGFIFSNNMTLMLRPEVWLKMYRAHPDGFNLNLHDWELWPRYLHMMIGAVAVASALLAHLGMLKLKKDPEYGAWLVRRAAAVFAITTGIQFLDGLWLLLAVPRDVAMVFLRDPVAGTVFGLALMAVITAVILMVLGSMADTPSPLVHVGVGMVVVTVFLMTGMRHLLRQAYLAPYLDPGAVVVKPQTSAIVIFFVLFVGGLATVAMMLWKLAKYRKMQSLAGVGGATA